MATDTTLNWIALDCSDEGSRVVVTPENEDRFVMSVRDAAEACRAAYDRDCFVRQFQALLERLAGWLHGRRDAVAEAFVTVRDADLLFVIIQRQTAFDPAMEDALTELDLAVAGDAAFDRLHLNVLALPHTAETAYATFLHPQYTWALKHGE